MNKNANLVQVTLLNSISKILEQVLKLVTYIINEYQSYQLFFHSQRS
uniref:Uncharacterized protein n=1 Tax=Arundo donax TaxID=35708 RepID=A0A0A9BJY9_ARUDO